MHADVVPGQGFGKADVQPRAHAQAGQQDHLSTRVGRVDPDELKTVAVAAGNWNNGLIVWHARHFNRYGQRTEMTAHTSAGYECRYLRPNLSRQRSCPISRFFALMT